MKSLFDQTPAQKFPKYDQDHPDIWTEFKQITFNVINGGAKHYGARAVYENIRYHRIIATGTDDFKVNNNYVRCYALKFMQQFPQHEGFFKLRESRPERPAA